MLKVPESVQKEWLEKELGGCLNIKEVREYLLNLYGDAENLKKLGITKRWDIFSSLYARRAGYLKSILDLESLPHDVCNTLINFNLQKLQWGISLPPALSPNYCIQGLLSAFLNPNWDTQQLLKSELGLLIECLSAYLPRSEKVLRLFIKYASRQESDPHFEKGRKSIMVQYANHIAHIEGCNFSWEVPKRGNTSFLRKLKELYKRIQGLGVSTHFIAVYGFIYENDEEYLKEVLEGGYYLLWPSLFDSAGDHYTFHISQLISLDATTQRVEQQ